MKLILCFVKGDVQHDTIAKDNVDLIKIPTWTDAKFLQCSWFGTTLQNCGVVQS